MNICLLTSSFPFDENDIAAPFVPAFVREVERLGHSVIVFTPAKSGAMPGWSTSGKVFRYDWFARTRRVVELKFSSPIDLLRMASLFIQGESQLRRVIIERRIDSCLALWAIPSGYLAMRTKRSLQVPYAVWTLGSDIHTWAKYPIVGSVIKRVLLNANACFADGFELARKTSALSNGKACEFLSSMRTLALDEVAHVELAPRRVHFLFIGRWHKVKGIDVLLEAFRLLVGEAGDQAGDLTVLGEGILEDYARRFIAQNRLEDRVRLVPNAPLPVLKGYLRQASCLVIPSRSESIPLVFGEALQARLPLIVSDVGDMGDLAREYRVARVVPPENAPALKGAMLEFIATGCCADARDQELLRLMDIHTSAERYVATMRSFSEGEAR